MSKIALSGDAAGTGTFTIASPNSNSNFTLTLPAESGTVLTTGSTTGISASALSTGTIPKARMYAGAVLQVVQTVKTDGFSVTGGAAFTDITGLSVTITPSSASNKILVMFSMYALQQGTTGTYASMVRLVRNGTNIYLGDAAGSAQQASAQIGSSNYNYAQNLSGTYLDSPATTSAVTYKIQVYHENGQNGFIGGSYNTGFAYDARVPSQILVMEIAG